MLSQVLWDMQLARLTVWGKSSSVPCIKPEAEHMACLQLLSNLLQHTAVADGHAHLHPQQRLVDVLLMVTDYTSSSLYPLASWPSQFSGMDT